MTVKCKRRTLWFIEHINRDYDEEGWARTQRYVRPAEGSLIGTWIDECFLTEEEAVFRRDELMERVYAAQTNNEENDEDYDSEAEIEYRVSSMTAQSKVKSDG